APDAVKVLFLNSLERSRSVQLYFGTHGEAVRPAVPGREVARSGRRALDAPDRPRPAAGTGAIPGPPRPAGRHSAEAPGGPLAADGAPGAPRARALFEAPATRLVRAHRARAWARSRRGRAGGLGPAVRWGAIGAPACDVRTSHRAAAV